MTGVVLIFRDITEKLRNQAAMMRADKLASAGRLSAAIAHEINNPLESLTNLIYLARSESNPVELHQHLAQAEIELSRIAHITRQSLGFYKGTEDIESFDPAQICIEVCSVYEPRAATKSVKLISDVATGVTVSGSSGELRQVIANLVANALDAVRQSGKVRIFMRPAPSPEGDVSGIHLCISDNGSGIPSKNIDRVFDPFYTTKGTTGTGLGLWVSRQLIEKRGGTINVSSRAGGFITGTRFCIWFPAEAPTVRSITAAVNATAQ
jgi:signal transduction histidine kinase